MQKKEMVEIVDIYGISTGEIVEKETAHDKNLLHKEVGLFIINSNNQVLLQKRSANKRFNPNKWGLCAGHVEAYEENDSAMLRELKEELGVTVNKNDIVHFDTVVRKRELNSHIRYEYYMFLDKDEKDFTIQSEELSEVKWIDFNKYKDMVKNNDSTITWSNNKYYINALKKLEKIIEEHSKRK